MEALGEVGDDELVEVLPPEIGVAVSREHLVDAVAHAQDRHVEGAAAEVEHRDGLTLLLLDPVREGRGGRLVDDAEHLEARDRAGVLRRLAL